MTTRFIQPGKVLDFTNAGTAIASGAAVVIGTRVGVALANIANGATGSVQICGVFQMPKTAGDTIAQGAPVYVIAATGVFTTTASGNVLAGSAAAAAGAGTTSVNVLLNNTPA
jgi:predicted RecA/RadA family phage recombinase